MDAILSALRTAWKYLFWTAVAAALVAIGNNLGGLGLPEWSIAPIAAALKAAATWAATQAAHKKAR
jgi:hypothetical protein